MYLYQFVTGGGIYGALYTRISIIAAFIPVIIFYLITNQSHGGSGNIFRDIKRSMETRKRQKEWRDQWK